MFKSQEELDKIIDKQRQKELDIVNVEPDIPTEELEDYEITADDREDIERIIDQAMEETEVNEKMKVAQEPIEEIKQTQPTKEIQVDEQVSNNAIYKSILELTGAIIKQKEKIKDLEKAVSKKWALLLLVFLLSGGLFYTIAVYHHDNIKPFIGDIVQKVIKSTPIGGN